MRDKIKKWALNKAADGLTVASGTFAALAAAARTNASDEVWDEPLPEDNCNCPACSMRRRTVLGLWHQIKKDLWGRHMDDGNIVGVRMIPFHPGDLLGKAIREAGGDPDGPLFDFGPLGGKTRGEA